MDDDPNIEQITTELFEHIEGLRLETRAGLRRQFGTSRAAVVDGPTELAVQAIAKGEVFDSSVTVTVVKLSEVFHWCSLIVDKTFPNRTRPAVHILGTNHLEILYFQQCPHCDRPETRVYGMVRGEQYSPMSHVLLICSKEGNPGVEKVMDLLGYKLVEGEIETDTEAFLAQDELRSLMASTDEAGFTNWAPNEDLN